MIRRHYILLLLIILSSCGTNVGESTAVKDPIDEALADMDNGKWDEAISILETELTTTTDLNLVYALLATAHAGKHGVDPINYSAKLGGTAEAGQNNITKTFSALPDATDENIIGIETAIEYINLIPEEERTLSNIFIAGMLYSVHVSLISKKFDEDGTGELSLEELANMTPEEAEAIIASLDAASDVFAGASVEGENSQKAAGKISAIQDEIAASPGASQTERLQNYLANQ